MNPLFRRFCLGFSLCLCLSAVAAAQEMPSARRGPELRRLDRPASVVVAIRSKSSAGTGAPDAAVDPEDDSDDQPPVRTPARRHRSSDNDRVSVLGSVAVEAGQTVRGDAVAVLGGLSVDGTVEGDAVAVLGNSTINGSVGGSAVAVFGDLTLGPTAHVRGDVVCVAGHLSRAPGAIIDGKVVQQGLGGVHPSLPMTAWWSQGLSHGRALAFGRHLLWLWVVNAVLIAFYALLALVFPGGIRRCGETLTQRPGVVVLASFLTILALPLVFVLLLITIVGIPVAFLALPLAILLGTLFGRAAIYGLVGRRIAGSRLHPSLAVILGAVFFLLLYLLPGLGLVLWLLVGFVGLGLAVATLFGRKAAPAMPPPPPAAPIPPFGGVGPGPATMTAFPSGPVAPGSIPDAGAPASATPIPDASGSSAAVPAAASPAASATESSSPTLGSPPPAASSVPPLLAAEPLASAPPPAVSSGPLSAAPLPSALTHPRAGFWIRTAALAIDLILVSAIFSWCLSPLLRGFFGSKGPFLPVMAIYGAILWKVRGSTIGGIIFGLRVVRVDDRPVDWGTAAVRALACFLSFLVFGLGFIWVAFDTEKQSWHDKIAGTTVVRASKPVSLV